MPSEGSDERGVAPEVVEAADRILSRILARPKQFPRADGLSYYEPRESDVIVTTFPKSGTTLMQQLVYQVVVCTGGACERDPSGMDFNDICEVVPVVDFGAKHGFPPFETRPRLFKSHFPRDMFESTTQKHIVVIRDPEAYPASYLDFVFDAWADEEVDSTAVREQVFLQLARIRLLGITKDGTSAGLGFPFERELVRASGGDGQEKQLPLGSWFLHARSWVRATRPGVLILFYEDIVRDLSVAARRVATFIGRELADDALKTVLTRCDRGYMATDDKFKCTLEARCLGFSDRAWKALPKGRDGFKQFTLTQADRDELAKRFRQEFGVDSYRDFMQLVKDTQPEPYM